MKGKKIVCPTCKQDMRLPPKGGESRKDCPQCGQGMTRARAALVEAQARRKEKA